MREYDKDFKEEAIKLSYELGPTRGTTAGDSSNNTVHMENNTKRYGEIAFFGSGHKRIDRKTAEIRAMEKKIKELEAANDILKSTLGFFARSQKK